MSDTIENQIVSLQFDNKHFEKNTKTSIKTLEKLREKLNFKGATKGLQNIDDASKHVKFETLANSIDTVKNKFSALEIMGVTALANLTNSAVNYGKRIVSALTIDPVNTGFSEYETKMGSIQTILANTSSKGKKLEDVTKVLNELNTYADKTIYNFAQMTRNIGTFTAAGVDLEVAAAAIQGIANIAAVSGSTSQQASVAMYQLSQAIAAGTVRLMDWNSVVNAGMGGEKFQNALIATAREMRRTTNSYAYDVDQLLLKNGSFRESLSEGWLTADVLNQTLKKFTVEGAKEYGQKMIDIGDWTQESADALVAMAQEMEDAAIKVKTFTQLWDTLKEAAQSGWAQTWEIIVGDFGQAKTFLTYLSDTISGILGRSADKRNTFLGIALNPVSTFNNLIQNAGLNLNYFQDKIKETAKKNEIAIDSLIKEHGSLSTVISEGLLPTNIFIEALESLTEEELRTAGYTKGQIDAIQELGVEAKKTGSSINDVINAMSQRSGWSLMFDSIQKVVAYIGEGLTHVKKAWSDTFSPIQSSVLYGFVKRLNDFASSLSITEETANKLYRTAKGVAALFDIIFSTVKGGWRLLTRFVSEILGVANIDVLELTARLGDLVVKFRDWLKSVVSIESIFSRFIPILRQAGQIVRNFLDTLRNSDNIPRDIILGLINGFKDGMPLIINSIIEVGKTIIETLRNVLGIHSPSTEAFEIMKWFVLGLVKGIKMFGKLVWEHLKKFGTGIKDVFIGIGDFAGLILDKIKPTMSSLYNLLNTSINKITSLVSELDLTTLLSAGLTGGSLALLYKFASGLLAFGKAAENISKPVRDLKNIFSSISIGIKKLTKAFSAQIKMKAVKDLAITIAILAGAVTALALIPDQSKLESAIGTIIILVGAVAGLSMLAAELTKFESIYGKNSTLKSSGAIFLIGATLLKMAGALAKIASIDSTKIEDAVLVLLLMTGTITLLAIAMATITQVAPLDKEIYKVGLMLIGVSASLLIFTKVLTAAAKASQSANLDGAIALVVLMSVLLGGMVAVSQLYSFYSKGMGKMLIGFTFDLLLLLGVVQIAASMQTRALLKGIIVIAELEALMMGLIAISDSYNKEATSLGKSMLGIATTILAMGLTIQLVGRLDNNVLSKGLLAILAFSGIVIGLIAATRLAGDKELKHMTFTLIGMGVCISLMSASVLGLSLLSIPSIIKGTAAVAALSAMLALMVHSTKDSRNTSKAIYALAVSIGVLTASIVGLSYLPAKDLYKAVGALSIVLASFSLVLNATSKLKGDKIVGQLISLAAITAILGGLMVLFDKMEVEPSITTCVLLSSFLLTMASAMLILSHMKNDVSKNTMITLGILATIVGTLYAVVKGVSSLTNVEPGIEAMIGVSILLNSMASAMLILSHMKNDVTKTTIQRLGEMAVIVSLLYSVVKGATYLSNVEPGIEAMIGVSILLNSMASAMLILSQMKKTVSKGVMGQLAIMAGIVGLLYAVTRVISLIPAEGPSLGALYGLSKVMIALANTLVILSNIKDKISYRLVAQLGLLAFIVSGFFALTKAASSFSTSLSRVSITNFIGIGVLINAAASALLILSKIKGSIGIDSLIALGTLSLVMSGLIGLISLIPNASELGMDIISAVSLGILINSLSAAALILSNFPDGAKLTGALKGIGIISLIIVALSGLVGLLGWIGDGIFGDNLENTLNAGVLVFKKIGEAIGGLIAGGFKPMVDIIVDALMRLIGCVEKFIGALNTVDPNAMKGFKIIADAILVLTAADVMNGLDLFGTEKFKKFGEKLVALAEPIVQFSNTIGNNTSEDALKAAKQAADTLLVLSLVMPRSGGWVDEILGSNDLDKFGEQVSKFGQAMVDFSTVVDGKIKKTAFEDAKAAGEIMIALQKTVPETGGVIDVICGFSDLATFGRNVKSFGKSMVGFSETVDGKISQSAVDDAKAAGETMLALQNSVPATGGLDDVFNGFQGLDKFGGNVKKYGEGIVSFVESISTTTIDLKKVQAAADAGGIMVTMLKEFPMRNNYTLGGLQTSMNTVADILADFNLRLKYIDVSKTNKVAKSIKTMVSSVFMLENITPDATKFTLVKDIISAAVETLLTSTDKINKAINEGMVIEPVIRPVLDLTNIREGASMIPAVLNTQPLVDALPNIGFINRNMNQISQNGNSDVVEAIDKLRESLGDIGNDTYNINGITYNDDSAIADAIRTIIRAINIERRA